MSVSVTRSCDASDEFWSGDKTLFHGEFEVDVTDDGEDGVPLINWWIKPDESMGSEGAKYTFPMTSCSVHTLKDLIRVLQDAIKDYDEMLEFMAIRAAVRAKDGVTNG